MRNRNSYSLFLCDHRDIRITPVCNPAEFRLHLTPGLSELIMYHSGYPKIYDWSYLHIGEYWLMALNVILNNISAISYGSFVLLVEEIGIYGKYQQPTESHCQTLPTKVVSITHRHRGIWLTTMLVIGICKSSSYYYTITDPTATYILV